MEGLESLKCLHGIRGWLWAISIWLLSAVPTFLDRLKLDNITLGWPAAEIGDDSRGSRSCSYRSIVVHRITDCID